MFRQKDPNNILLLQRIAKCRLYLSVADTQTEVAIGRAFQTDPGDTCHGVPIRADDRKVKIDVCNEHCGEYKLPIPHPEFRDLQEAIGSFVIWPKKWIAFGSGQAPGASAPSPKGSTPMSAWRERRAPLLNDAQVGLLFPACCNLYDVLMAQPEGDYTFQVEYGEDNLGIGGTTMVTTGAVVEMLQEQRLELTILQLFSITSARRCKRLTLDRFRFPDPYRCSSANIKNESDYLTAFIERVEPESFVILPYHQEVHWYLLILHLAESQCYVLDSLRNPLMPKLTIGAYMNIAFRNYWTKRGVDQKMKKLKWVIVTGPMQLSGCECGYYIMRTMHEVINGFYDAATLPSVIGPEEYGRDQLDEVRDLVAELLLYESS